MRFLPVLATGLGLVHGSFTSRESLWGIRGGEQRSISLGLIETTKKVRCVAMHTGYSAEQEVYASSALDSDAVEALATTSDVIVLSVDPTAEIHDESVTNSIVKAVERRREQGMASLAVVVVLVGIMDAEEAANWKELVRSGDLSQPMSSLQVVREDQVEQVLYNVMADLPTDELRNDMQLYEALLRQVYQSLTSKTSTLKLKAVVDAVAEPVGKEKLRPEAPPPVATSKDVVREAPFPADPPEDSGELGTLNDTVNDTLFQQALDELEELDSQQEEMWLGDDSQVPLLHFGSAANSILTKARDALDGTPSKDAELNRVLENLRGLYVSQLQALREHYGRKYDTALDETSDEQERTNVAARVTDGFRAAAQHAIPELCREGQEFERAADFGYVVTLQGLVSDMMEATSMRQDYDEALEANETKQPAKWYEKLAARALVLGVNYLQGWLAWQGIKKAAVQRDKDMPKFPLF